MSASAPEHADDLGPQIDAMLADAEQRAESAPTAPALEPDDGFQSEMISAVGEAEAAAAAAARRGAQSGSAAPPPSTAQPSPATIDELDEQLAESAPHEDDLPAQPTPATEDHSEKQTLEEMREEVAQALTAPPMELDDDTPAPEAHDEPFAEPEPEPEPASEAIATATDEVDTPEPGTRNSEPDFGSRKEPEPTSRRPSPLLAMLRAIPIALAWPLSFLPPAARDQIGWLALVTLFNAGAVWVYLLLKH